MIRPLQSFSMAAACVVVSALTLGCVAGAPRLVCREDEVLLRQEDGASCVPTEAVGGGPNLPSCPADEVAARKGNVWHCIPEPIDVLDTPQLSGLTRPEREAIREAIRFAAASPNSMRVFKDTLGDSEGIETILPLIDRLPAALYVVSWARNVGYVHHFGNCICVMTGSEDVCSRSGSGLNGEQIMEKFKCSKTGGVCAERLFGLDGVEDTLHARLAALWALTGPEILALAPMACKLASYYEPCEHTRTGTTTQCTDTTSVPWDIPVIVPWYDSAWAFCDERLTAPECAE